MKIVAIVILAAALPGLAAAQQPGKRPMRDAATHEQLIEAARTAAEEAKEKPPLFTPSTPEQKEQEKAGREPRSLLGSSDIICYRGHATLVPKRALVHVPKDLSERLGMQEGARFQTFEEFLARNKAWITTTPVSRKQAEGKEPMSEAVIKSFEKETRIVVATLQNGPISVLPPKVEEPLTTTAQQ